MTQPQVSAFLAEWDAAQQNNDLEGVVARLSPKLHCEMTVTGFGPTRTVITDYDQYIKSTKSGFGSSQTLNSKRELSLIAVNPDGLSASVMFEVREAMDIEGRLYRTMSSGTMGIELEDGKMVITNMKFAVSPASDRNPLEPNIPRLPKM